MDYVHFFSFDEDSDVSTKNNNLVLSYKKNMNGETFHYWP